MRSLLSMPVSSRLMHGWRLGIARRYSTTAGRLRVATRESISLGCICMCCGCRDCGLGIRWCSRVVGGDRGDGRSPPLGVHLRGPSVWVVGQVLHEPLLARIRQLALDPGVDPTVVRQLRGTAADMEMAAHQYRAWEAARNATESTEVLQGGLAAGLDCPFRWVDAGSVAASLGCSMRWVTQLCLVGRLAAVKRGRSWLIDPDSVRDYMLRGANAA
jgi:hypothetical protein